MSTVAQKKVESLDAEILGAVEVEDFNLAKKKNATKKTICELMLRREDAEKEHAGRILNADDLYLAAKNAGDDQTMEKIIARTLTKEEFYSLSKQYNVNQDVFDYGSNLVGGGTIISEQQAELDTFAKHTYPERIKEVREQFKDSDDVHRENVEEFAKNPEKIHFGVDAQGDVYIELVDINKKIKGLNLQSLPENMKKRWTDKELLSKTQSTGYQECVYSGSLNSKEFDDCLKAHETYGYHRNADKEDEVMRYLAVQFGMTYNNKPTGEYQPIMKIKMALLHRLGWDFVRRDKNGVNLGELYKKNIDNIQIAYMDGRSQILDRHYDVNYDRDASVMLVAG